MEEPVLRYAYFKIESKIHMFDHFFTLCPRGSYIYQIRDMGYLFNNNFILRNEVAGKVRWYE